MMMPFFCDRPQSILVMFQKKNPWIKRMYACNVCVVSSMRKAVGVSACILNPDRVPGEAKKTLKCVNQKVKECFFQGRRKRIRTTSNIPIQKENPTTLTKGEKIKKNTEGKSTYKRGLFNLQQTVTNKYQSKRERGECKEDTIIKYELYSTIG